MNLPSDPTGQVGAASPGVHPVTSFLPAAADVAPFEFRSLSTHDADELLAAVQADECADSRAGAGVFPQGGQSRAARDAEFRLAIEAASKEGFLAGEQQGKELGRAQAKAELAEAMNAERHQISKALSQFRTARDRYFADVEQEVVKLSLAIAERVLHREAQIDPLLLTGVVRVALEKMADRSGVVLRVSGEDVAAWERVFHLIDPSERPRVAEDARLERGECVLETRMGTVELGVRVQLEEIEKGFFDLLNHRPVE